MILNHKQAIKFLVENLEAIEVNNFTILNLHGLLSESLLPNPADSGNLRTKIVDISGSVYRPTVIPQLINERFTLILAKARMIRDPFKQAFFIMIYVWAC